MNFNRREFVTRISALAAAAKDKTLAYIKGANHGFESVEPAAGGKNTQDEAARVIAEWLRPRFPV